MLGINTRVFATKSKSAISVSSQVMLHMRGMGQMSSRYAFILFKKLLHVTFKWRRINKKVGANYQNKFPTPFFKQEKSRRKVLRVTIIRKNGTLECYVQYRPLSLQFFCRMWWRRFPFFRFGSKVCLLVRLFYFLNWDCKRIIMGFCKADFLGQPTARRLHGERKAERTGWRFH
jgi:hypothetical protein